MDFTQVTTAQKRKTADVLILPFFKGKDGAKAAFHSRDLKQFYSLPIEMKDFQGKEGEILMLYPQNEVEKRCMLLGLGETDKMTVEKLRRSFATVSKACQTRRWTELNLILPLIPAAGDQELVKGIVEGLLLANYRFDSLRSEKKEEDASKLLTKVCLIHSSKQVLEIAEKYLILCEGVYFARDLVNGNADDVTPHYLAKVAMGIAKQSSKVTATVFDKKRIEKEKMGLLLAVNRGSASDPTFIILEYKGQPKSKEKTVLVGKGITFDTGGLNLKASGMETMRDDMAGAAAALAAVKTAALLNLKINVTAVVPSTENALGSKSYKPGDVYKSYLGKTVEIGNTDAEGRLILADALAYVVKNLKPTRIIDFATLTAAIIIALGSETIGLFSNNDALSDSLIRSGSDTYERVWRMPLYEEYKDLLKSDIADIKNIGGRAASSITAALFLQEFVGNVPWAHLDIAGTAFSDENKRYHGKFGTGSGVRLIMDFLENLH